MISAYYYIASSPSAIDFSPYSFDLLDKEFSLENKEIQYAYAECVYTYHLNKYSINRNDIIYFTADEFKIICENQIRYYHEKQLVALVNEVKYPEDEVEYPEVYYNLLTGLYECNPVSILKLMINYDKLVSKEISISEFVRDNGT